MPTGFGSIAAHAFGNEAKPGGSACLGRELQAPPLGQTERLAEFKNDKSDAAVAKGFLGGGEDINLIPGLDHQKPIRIEEIRQSYRVEPILTPALAYPD